MYTDTCADIFCENGGTCDDSGDVVVCLCPEGSDGLFCAIKDQLQPPQG